jgi:hypothetical protein
MRKEYDFSKSRKNPYASQLKKQITIRLDEDAITYFKAISKEIGIPYLWLDWSWFYRRSSGALQTIEPQINADEHR